MKKLVLAMSLLLCASSAACSKHECKLESDEEKKVLGEVANMTQGAFSCSVNGASAISGLLMTDLQCKIGNKDCVPMLEVVHGDGADVDSVSAGYRKWLKENKWEITSDEAKESKAMNGKTLNGVELKANHGDQGVLVRLFPFGDKLVQGRVLVVDKDKLKE